MPNGMAATRKVFGMFSVGVVMCPLVARVLEGRRQPARARKAATATMANACDEGARARREHLHEHRQAQVLVAMHGDRGADHRHPEKRQ